MKMNRRRNLLMVVMIAILLTATIGGTIAWLTVSTQEIVNTFTPGNVDTEIDEQVDNGVKSSVVIENEGNVPVYVRVAVVGNYVDDESGEIVAAWTPAFTVGTGWSKSSDGYYYYTSQVEPGGKTSDLLERSISADTSSYPGAHLEVTVIHQSIQAEPTSAVSAAWGFVPGTSN